MAIAETPQRTVNWAPLVGAERAEIIRALRRDVADGGLNHTDGLRSLSRAVALLAPAVLTVYVALRFESWWAWALHVVVATAVLCTLPAVYHEATHGNVSRNKIVNDAAGTLAAALHWVPFVTWRYFHLTHHANTGTEDDSEVYTTHWSRWTLITFPLTQWVFLAILWRWTVGTIRFRGPRWIRSERQRRAVVINTVATLLIWLIEIALFVLDPRMLLILLVPCALSLMFAALSLVPEHFPAYQIGPGDPDQLDRTGTFRSNPLIRLIMWNSNFHAAHHFAPKVPAHRLRELDGMVSKIQDPAWRWSGYYRWYRDRVRELSWSPMDMSVPPENRPNSVAVDLDRDSGGKP
jgi:fatty acid desaturase